MAVPSPWTGFYQSLPDGHPFISGQQLVALEIKDASRIFDTKIAGRAARVLILDLPFRVGDRIKDKDAYRLHRILIRELPGWPPTLLTPVGTPLRQPPNALACALKEARFQPGGAPGQGTVDLDLEYQGHLYRALHSGCPSWLLQCLVATLKQHGAIDNRLMTLQDARLSICEE